MDVDSGREVVGFAGTHVLPDAFTKQSSSTANFTRVSMNERRHMRNLGHLEGDTNGVSLWD